MSDSATSPSLRETYAVPTEAEAALVAETLEAFQRVNGYHKTVIADLLTDFGHMLVKRLDAPTVAERESRARAEGPGWQPIETAPKDRTPVLLTVPRIDPRKPPIVGEAYFDPEADGGSWWWAGTRVDDYHDTSINDGNEPPIAWMPLPAPPALIQEARHEG